MVSLEGSGRVEALTSNSVLAADDDTSVVVASAFGDPLRIANPLPSNTASFAGMFENGPFGLAGSSLIEITSRFGANFEWVQYGLLYVL
jgi:hypothetical protein